MTLLKAIPSALTDTNPYINKAIDVYAILFFGTWDLFNISYSRELYLFSKFLHFEEIVRVKMAVCFEMNVSEK